MANEFIARNGIVSKSNLIVSGSLTALSTITAQTLVVQTITSSISSITGSTNFGSLSVNTHTFTGSMNVSGSGTFIGNLGIGEASNEKLAVTGLTGSQGFIRWTDGVATSAFLGISGSTSFIHANNNILAFGANGSNNFAATMTLNSGNVGIGTATPAYKLDVSGTLRTSGQYKNTFAGQSISIDAASTNSARIQLQNTGANAGIAVESSTGGDQFSGTSAYSMAIGTYTEKNFHIGTNSVTRMTITSAGNVGIGTSSPLGRFDIFRAAGLSGTPTIVISSGESPSRNWSLNTDVVTDGDFAICVSTTTGGTPSPTSGNTKFYVTKNGNVAIGTTTIPSDSIGLIIGGTNSSLWRAYGSYSGNACGMDLSNGSNTTTVQFFGSSGNYYFAGSNISDRRSKTNIQAINNALSNLLQLKPSTFAYNLHPTIIKGGFIAQEVQEVLPDFVTVPEDETEMMGVDYNGILALAVKSIQELTARVQYLENK